MLACRKCHRVLNPRGVWIPTKSSPHHEIIEAECYPRCPGERERELESEDISTGISTKNLDNLILLAVQPNCPLDMETIALVAGVPPCLEVSDSLYRLKDKHLVVKVEEEVTRWKRKSGVRN